MTQKIQNEIRNRGGIFTLLGFGLLLSFAMYVYLLSATVHATALRQQTEKTIYTLENKSEGLESRYVNLKSSITAELATARGFVSVSGTKYIPRETAGKVLSLVTEL